MHQSLFLLGTILLASSSAAIADSRLQKSAARAVEAVVAPDGQVVAIQPAVERLSEGTSEKAGSPCGAPINMDGATARALVEKIAKDESFYPEFVLAIAHGESQFDPNALSPKGAIGLMQLEPATAQRYKVNICDPADNVRGGIRFLRDLHARYRNPLFILAAYNAGEENLQHYRGVPPYPETVRFVATVINEFYDWPAAGGNFKRNSAPKGQGPKSATPFKDVSPSSRTTDNHWQSGFVWNVQ